MKNLKVRFSAIALMILPVVASAQFNLGSKEDTVLTADKLYDEPDNFSFFALQAIPISGETNQSNTSINFGLAPMVLVNSKLLLSGNIVKAYTDELRSDNNYSSPSYSIYKEHSTFRWSFTASYPLYNKLTDSKQTFHLDKQGNTNYVTSMEVKKYVTIGPSLGFGYRAGHVDDFANKFDGIQVNQTTPAYPFTGANRSILDFQYLNIGFVRNVVVNSAFDFSNYGPRAIGRVNKLYFDLLIAYKYNLDNIVMEMPAGNADIFSDPVPNVEYNLQDNTPFSKFGGRLGFSSTTLRNLYSQTLGLELGVHPGVGFDFYSKIYIAIGLVKATHSTRE